MAQPFDNPFPGRPLVESPFFEVALPGMGLDVKEARIPRDLHTQGFAALDPPMDHFNAIAERPKTDLVPAP